MLQNNPLDLSLQRSKPPVHHVTMMPMSFMKTCESHGPSHSLAQTRNNLEGSLYFEPLCQTYSDRPRKLIVNHKSLISKHYELKLDMLLKKKVDMMDKI